MERKITFTRRVGCRGMTLLEMLFAVAIGLLVTTASMATLLFSLRSSQSMTNYENLDNMSRFAVDTMSADIRQANGCSTNAAFSSSSLTLIGTNAVTLLPYTINYNYNSVATTLTRTYTATNVSQAELLLTNCTYFAFSYFQRNPSNGAFGVFPIDTNSPSLCKAVQVDWNCARSIMGSPVNTECGESAMIVIRKQ
jgi:prepilin-type N-terminal cleavage/methylation domain-containing protein